MRHNPDRAPRFAVCIDNSGYEACLELHKIYSVVKDPEAARDAASRFMAIDIPKTLASAILSKTS